MTNELIIATMVMVSYVTNIIERVPENGPRGNTWYRTNVISAVIELTPPGLPAVTNTVAVATNVMRLSIVSESVPTPSLSQRERAGVRESRPTTQPLSTAAAAALGLPKIPIPKSP